MHLRGLSLPLATYRKRRRQAAAVVRQAVGAATPILVLGASARDLAGIPTPLAGRARQDAWFDWFTGCHEADAALLIEGARSTLFLDTGDPKRVIYEGARLPPGPGARRRFGVEATAPAGELASRVADAARRCGHRLALLWRKREPGVQSEAAQRWRQRLRGITALNAEPHLLPLRMVKTGDEIAWHRRAVAVTAAAYREVMRALPRLRHEGEIGALLARQYLAPTSDPLAFQSICAGGANAATLHYPHGDQPLAGARCVLIDSGATRGGYCADVTRTLPRRGRFTDRRLREVYDLVLKANRLAIRHARPGITLTELNDLCWKPILDAGFTRHHNLSHHIGLDVHDPADRDRPLSAGMLISDEPGIYLPDEGIGVRIEEDLLITADGCEVTTRAIPATIAGIEAAMAG